MYSCTLHVKLSRMKRNCYRRFQRTTNCSLLMNVANHKRVVNSRVNSARVRRASFSTDHTPITDRTHCYQLTIYSLTNYSLSSDYLQSCYIFIYSLFKSFKALTTYNLLTIYQICVHFIHSLFTDNEQNLTPLFTDN